MLTILHTIETSGPGGAENVVLNLLRQLSGAEFRNIVCLRREGWLAGQMRALGLTVHIIPLTARFIDIAWLRAVRKLIADEHVDVMHAHEFTMNVHCSVLSILTGTPTVSTVHGRHYFVDRWYRRLAYRWVARHSHLVAVSDDIHGVLNKEVGIDANRIEVVRNGIDVDRFAADSAVRARQRSALGVDPDTVLLGAVGNLYAIKGHTHLVQAAAIISQSFDDFRVVVAGRGELQQALEAQVRDAGLTGKVDFLGFREDVQQLLQAFDIFVMPSESEGIPLSVLEAMAASLPVVVTRVGGLAEVVTADVGRLCKPKSAEELAVALLPLMQDAVLRRQMGEQGLKRVRQHFSVQSMRNGYIEAYHSLVRSHAT